MSHFYDLAVRFWDDLVSRPSGPLAFRLIVQPLMASALAIRDGIRDARRSRSPYFWTIYTDPTRRKARLVEGIRAVSRVLVFAAVVDVAYQLIALHGLRPFETVVIAVVLAFLPYLIVRGPANRIARRIFAAKAAAAAKGDSNQRNTSGNGQFR